MTGNYYIECLDRLPAETLQNILKESAPAWLAWCIVAGIKLNSRLGFSSYSCYATDWCDEPIPGRRSDLPHRALAKWAGQMEQLQDLNFQELGYFQSVLIGAKQECLALFLSPDGQCLALLTWLRIQNANAIEEVTPVEFKSIFSNGDEVVTGVLKREHAIAANGVTPDYVDLVCVPLHTKLSDAYQQHTARCTPASAIVCSSNPEIAIERYVQQRRRLFEHCVATGLLKKATTSQLKKIQKYSLPN